MLTSRSVGIELIHAKLTESAPVGLTAAPSRRAASRGPQPVPQRLLHHLVLVDTPEVAALDPAGVVGGVDAAPVGTAFEQPRDDARFGAGNGRRSYVRLAMESADPALDDNGPLAREHSLVHPALRSLPVPDQSPVFEFLGDLDRHLLAGQHPLDRVILSWADPEVHLIRAQADKPRQFLARVVFGGRGDRRPENESGQQQPWRGPDEGVAVLLPGHPTPPLANGVPRLLRTSSPCGRSGHSSSLPASSLTRSRLG